MIKNKLIVYQGGGYDGCICEWNACLFDSDGVVHDIYSSGYSGLFTDYNKRKRSYEARPDTAPKPDLDIVRSEITDTVQRWLDNSERDVEAFDISDDADCKAFAKAYNCAFVRAVVTRAEDVLDRETLYWLCSDCGKKFYGDAGYHYDHWHGIGGIASQPEVCVCDDCHSNGTCDECHEYYGAKNLNEYGTCEDCLKQAVREREVESEEIDQLDEDLARVARQVVEYAKLVPSEHAQRASAWLSDERIRIQNQKDRSIRNILGV